MSETDAMSRLNRLQQIAQIVAGVGLVLAGILAFWLGWKSFVQSYLMAYVFWFGLSLGCLGLLFIHHLAGLYWSFSIRRLLEAGAILIPLVALLFLPIIFGMNDIYYRWLDVNYEGRDALIIFKTEEIGYLTMSGFLLRTVLYFLIWTGLAFLLWRWSGDQDKARDGDFSHAKRMRLLSGAGVVLFVITMTMASVDWFMSIEPHFFSTIYGVMYMIGQGLSTLAFMLVLLWYLIDTQPFKEVFTTTRIHSIGKMMLAFVILWTYVSYAQYIIIWSGNIPEFTPWYINRTELGWQLLALMLILFHFAVPFFLLLSRRLKKDLRLLWLVAALILVMRLIDIFWLIAPEFFTTGLQFDPLYIANHLLLGGIWITAFVIMLKRRPLMPLNELRKDPRVQEGAHAHA